jgi:hypothetical protein
MMNGLTLDLLAALLCGAMALVLFLIHAMTAKAHGRWITLPMYVRAGVGLTGMAFMIWSVNLITLGGQPSTVSGHMNLEGVVATSLMLYTLTTTAFWLGNVMRARRAELSHMALASADIYEFEAATPVPAELRRRQSRA